MSKKLTSWLLCGGLLLALVSSAAAQANRGLIRLTRIAPEVAVQDTESQTRVSYTENDNGTQIDDRSIVITTGEKSRVILVFSNGATINLAADSQLNIREFRQDPFAGSYSVKDATNEPEANSTTELFLQYGELVGNVKKLRSDSKFTVGTPAGAAGIRGTTFRVIFRPTGTGQAFFSVTTLEGDVAVTTVEGNADVPLGVLDMETVELIVEVDDETGEVISVIPTESLTANAASPEQAAEITSSVQQSVESVVDIVMTANNDQLGSQGDDGDAPESGDNFNGDQGSEGDDSGVNSEGAPPAVNPIRTTSESGLEG